MLKKEWKRKLLGLSPDARSVFLRDTPVWLPAQRTKAAGDSPEPGGPVWFRVTDSDVDREGDILLSAGMDTTNYLTSGSLLWGHDASTPHNVLGRPSQIIHNGSSIDVAFEFASEINPMAAMVEAMVRDGFVSGVSVGIMVREYTEATDRSGWSPINVIRSELLEVSVTPIPANPRATKIPVEEEPADEEIGEEEPADEDAASQRNVDPAVRQLCNMLTQRDGGSDAAVCAFLKALRR